MTCTCNDEDGIYTIDGKPTTYAKWFDFCMTHNDWVTRTTSDMPKGKRCRFCRGEK